MIYFIKTEYSGETAIYTRVTFNEVYKSNPYGRWKRLPDNLRIAYDGEEEGEVRDMYCDFVDLLFWYKNINKEQEVLSLKE